MPTANAGQQLKTPVAFILFNRPEQTGRVFSRIAEMRPERLLLIADGPRTERADEAGLCQQAREVVATIDWDCEVLTNFSDTNLGCKRRIASGLDWVFAQVEYAIILEDDCLPDPGFFGFCEQMLQRYAEDERVWMVRGSNLLFGKYEPVDSYYFSRLYNIWGWASWARAWQHYDVDMPEWPALRKQGWLHGHLGNQQQAKLVTYLLDQVYSGALDTWDYQWLLAGWQRDAMSVVPARNLITNIGFGEGATNTGNTRGQLTRMKTESLPFPLQHPVSVRVDLAADAVEWRNVYPQTTHGAGGLKYAYRRLRDALQTRSKRGSA